MAELTGNPGFAPPRKRQSPAAWRTAPIEVITTLGLTVALIIAATAVSFSNRSLIRSEAAPRAAVQNPASVLVDEANDWLAVSARVSARPL
jgi:hypothetical protein